MSRLEQSDRRRRVRRHRRAADRRRAAGSTRSRERFEPYEECVDAVNATDNTAAHAHASPLAVAIALKQLGVEPVMQLVCRDRNRLALEADIVGAALHGIENICCLTGDDVTAGDEPEARRVFDLDSAQLLATARRDRRRPVSLRPPDRPRAAPLPRRGREPRRAAVRVPRRARAQEGRAPARASSSSRSASSTPASSASWPRPCAAGSPPSARADPVDLPRPHARGAALHGREGAGHLGARGADRARRGRGRPRGGLLRARVSRSPSARSRCPASPACT